MNPAIATILEGARLNALLIAVLELDLCSFLQRAPRTAAELASAAGVSLRGCQALADGMVGLRLWTVEDGVYRNTRLAEAQLVRGMPDYIGDGQPEMFRYWLRAFERTAELVRAGEPAQAIDSAETLKFWSFLTPVLARKGRGVPVHALTRIDLQLAAPRLVDVGGGAEALYSRTFLERYPAGVATQVDWPAINEQARAACIAADCGDRFRTIDGDFHDAKIPEDAYDLAVLSHIIHQESPGSVQALLGTLFRALHGGGRIVISDWVVRNGRTGPASSLHFNLTAFLLSPQGKSYEESEIVDLLESSGFVQPEVFDSQDRATLVIARKP